MSFEPFDYPAPDDCRRVANAIVEKQNIGEAFNSEESDLWTRNGANLVASGKSLPFSFFSEFHDVCDDLAVQKDIEKKVPFSFFEDDDRYIGSYFSSHDAKGMKHADFGRMCFVGPDAFIDSPQLLTIFKWAIQSVAHELLRKGQTKPVSVPVIQLPGDGAKKAVKFAIWLHTHIREYFLRGEPIRFYVPAGAKKVGEERRERNEARRRKEEEERLAALEDERRKAEAKVQKRRRIEEQEEQKRLLLEALRVKKEAEDKARAEYEASPAGIAAAKKRADDAAAEEAQRRADKAADDAAKRTAAAHKRAEAEARAEAKRLKKMPAKFRPILAVAGAGAP